jgi:plastocyanin
MAEADGGHGAETHDGSEPPASAWPLVTVMAILILGIVLLWWWNDEGSDLTEPVLGASIVIVVIAVGASLFESMSQGRREERYGDAGDPRKTQVITFGIAEGRYADAETGVLAALRNAHEQLRNESGFEDLRVIASRSDSGVSQAIVETTWSSAGDLASYDSTRATMLDLVNGHPDEVVAGSVQAFDMDVVRDTKDVFVRMGFGAATTILTAILIGGLAVGAVISATSDDVVASDEGDGGAAGPVATTSIEVVATDNAFDRSNIVGVAGEEFTVEFVNDGAVFHNITFLTEEGGEPLAENSATELLVAGGATETITFVAPSAGTYFYLCTLHPLEMTGTFTVTAGGGAAASDGEGPGSSTSAPAGSLEVVANNIAFDQDTISATAGEDFTVTLVNDDNVVHNIKFLDEEGGELLSPDATTSDLVAAGDTETITFTAPSAGTYFFYCSIHPNQMTGTFTVTEG